MKRFWWIGLLLFLLAVVWAGAQEKPILMPVQPIEPIPDRGKVIDKGRLSPIEKVTSTPEAEKTLDKPTLKPVLPVSGLQEVSPQHRLKGLGEFSPIAVLQESPPQFQSLTLKEIPPVQGLDGISYQVKEFNDFRGGLDLVSAKTKVAPNCAIELENALWNPQGEMYKRPGYSEHSTPPEILNFLYRYYQQDGDKWTIGGSDTTLYFWHEDSSDWTYLIGTEGTEGRWDGTTFEDMFVGTHEGIVPVVWNGSTFVTMGTSVDSFRIQWVHASTFTNACDKWWTGLYFYEEQTGWDINEWTGYIVTFVAAVETASALYDTIQKKAFIDSNISSVMNVGHNQGFAGNILTGYYAKILSWFGVDTVWREGQLDSVNSCTAPLDQCRAWDEDFSWDSTFNYDLYIFEVLSGTGEGLKCFLSNYYYDIQQYCGWNDSAFIIPVFGANCFDSTTVYRIYRPGFLGEGSKFVETFDGSLWLGWTGIGEEQNKNIVVWSETDDLGNWPPENHIIIESDDGDFITGMAKFPGEYTDVPRQEMIVTKNNSLYKIVPSGDAYNFWLVQSGVGCVSNSAISPAEGILLFPDQHGVWAYDKRKPVSISQKIDPIFEAWDTENLEDASAVYNPQDRHYYITYPGPDETEPIEGMCYCESEIDTTVTCFVVTWVDKRTGDGTVSDIYATRLNCLGHRLCDDFKVNNDDSAYQRTPMVGMKEDRSFLIVFADDRANMGTPTKYDLYFQKYDADGNTVGNHILINDDDSSTAERHDYERIAMNPDGTWAVTWMDGRYVNDVYPDIWGQCYDTSWVAVDTNFLVNTDDISLCIQEYPSVAMDDDGNWVTIWTDFRDPHGSSAEEIYAQMYNSAGETQDTNWLVNDKVDWSENPGLSHYTGSVAMDADGNFVVAYMFEDIGGVESIFHKRFDANGNSLGIERKVNDQDPDTIHDMYPQVAMAANGKYVICWEDSRYGPTEADDHVMCQLYSANGTKIDTNFMVDDSMSIGKEAMQPEIAMDRRGNFIVVYYTDAGVYTSNCFARMYNSDGTPMGPSFQVNSQNGAVSYDPHVAMYPGPPLIGSLTLAWNMDHHGWSKESFSASAYCYQHSIFDEVKILFANPEDTFVYNYGTQADDINDPVILTYQTPYVNFGQYPSFDYEMRFATVEAFLDTGNIYLTWYKNYNDSTYYDSLICGSDCRQEMILPADSLWGWNISMKLKTGSNIDDFTLSRFWWEFTEDQNRK